MNAFVYYNHHIQTFHNGKNDYEKHWSENKEQYDASHKNDISNNLNHDAKILANYIRNNDEYNFEIDFYNNMHTHCNEWINSIEWDDRAKLLYEAGDAIRHIINTVKKKFYFFCVFFFCFLTLQTH